MVNTENIVDNIIGENEEHTWHMPSREINMQALKRKRNREIKNKLEYERTQALLSRR